jgi:hypothetical protein
VKQLLAILCCTTVLIVGTSAHADTVIRKDESQLECLVTSPPCPTCHAEQIITCPVCNGEGKLQADTCPRCNGQGKIACPTCKGLGYAGDEINIMAKGGIRMSIPAADIASITKKKGSEDDFLPPKVNYRNKASEVAPNDPKANMDLAQWCMSAGLVDEAEVHFVRARLLDPSLAAKIDPFLSRIRQEREKKVGEAVSKALELITRNRMEEAKAALEDVVAKHPESEIVRSPMRQKEAITAALGNDAERWGLTLEQVIDSLDKRLKMLCPSCNGAGSVTCVQCKGTGDADCARCRGTGSIVCPDCNNTGKQLCPRCLGTGHLKQRISGLGNEVSGPCPLCNGTGTIRCQTCGAKGRILCPECKGAGHLKGACPLCNGTGRQQCNMCLGTGLRPPQSFKWGPYPALPPGSTAGGGPVGYQGKVGAAVVTAVPATIVHGGRLALFLDKQLGGKYSYMLLCVDNRTGDKSLRFEGNGRSLRIVTPDARQIEMVPPATVVAAVVGSGAAKDIVQALTPGDVLPGVVKSFICVFPADATVKPGTRVFWGADDVWELDLVDCRNLPVEE